ncbi:hypothetical protein Tco_1108806 [Tanacetum coccineum]
MGGGVVRGASKVFLREVSRFYPLSKNRFCMEFSSKGRAPGFAKALSFENVFRRQESGMIAGDGGKNVSNSLSIGRDWNMGKEMDGAICEFDFEPRTDHGKANGPSIGEIKVTLAIEEAYTDEVFYPILEGGYDFCGFKVKLIDGLSMKKIS